MDFIDRTKYKTNILNLEQINKVYNIDVDNIVDIIPLIIPKLNLDDLSSFYQYNTKYAHVYVECFKLYDDIIYKFRVKLNTYFAIKTSVIFNLYGEKFFEYKLNIINDHELTCVMNLPVDFKQDLYLKIQFGERSEFDIEPEPEPPEPPEPVKKYTATLKFYDTDKKPVPNLKVKLTNGDTGNTDQNGIVIFTNLKPDTYYISVDTCSVSPISFGISDKDITVPLIYLCGPTGGYTVTIHVPRYNKTVIIGSGSKRYSSVTDSKGIAIFKNIPNGVYTIKMENGEIFRREKSTGPRIYTFDVNGSDVDIKWEYITETSHAFLDVSGRNTHADNILTITDSYFTYSLPFNVAYGHRLEFKYLSHGTWNVSVKYGKIDPSTFIKQTYIYVNPKFTFIE